MKMVELGSICKISSGGTPNRKNKSFYGGDIYWAKISDITKSNKILKTTEEKITQRGLKDIRNKLFKKGTLFFSMYGSIGKVAFTDNQMSCNQAILGINPINNKVDLQYLYYYFIRFQKKLENSTRGVALKNLSATIVKQIKIPLPPLPVQKRIAAILDQADELRQKDQQLIDHYDQLSQSLFLDMFGDPVTNPKGFEVGTIRDVVTSVKYGTSKKASEEGRFKYLRMNNIDYNGNMNYNSLKYIDLEPKQIEKYNTKKGDILFNRTNSKELVGKTGLIQEEPEMILAGYLIRVRVNSRVNPYFLWKHLNSSWAKQTLNHMCKNIVGMANINAQELQDITTLIPPIALQNEFAERVRAIEHQKQQAEKAARYSEELFQSLLQRAFKGELVQEEQIT